ncbi:MAG: poly(R)-hydroxyalkanoic acid synthase subunit PhaE [Pseudomonadota bacterium]
MSKDGAADFDFNGMMDMWAKGQQAFFQSQTDMARGFAEAVTSKSPEAAQEAGMATWSKMMEPFSVPGFNPAAMPAAMFDPTMMANAVTMMGQTFAGQAMAGHSMMGNGMAGAPNPMAMFAFMDPSTWAQTAPDQIRTFLQSIAGAPRFADLASPQADAAEVWRETLDYQTAAADFAGVLQTAWAKALKEFSAEYSLEELQDGDVQKALDAWLKAANAALLETQHSSDFMDAQRRLMRAGLEIQSRQKEIAEKWSAAYQMPTRTEIDDLTRIVHELRRSLRETKRELAALKASTET